MNFLKSIVLVGVLFAVFENAGAEKVFGKSQENHESSSHHQKRNRHLRKLFRHLGSHNLKKDNFPSPFLSRYDDGDSYYPDSNYLREDAMGETETPTRQAFKADHDDKSSQLSVAANDRVIFARSLDLDGKQWNFNFGNALSDNTEEHEADFFQRKSHQLPRHHHHRNARSVSLKGKGPLISSFRRINREPDEMSLLNEQASTSENEPQQQGQFATEEGNKGENSISDSTNQSNAALHNLYIGSKHPNVPATVTEAVSTPNNGGVTKVEVNLSFGCLFFCE